MVAAKPPAIPAFLLQNVNCIDRDQSTFPMMLALKISLPKRKVSRIEKLLGTPQLSTIFLEMGPQFPRRRAGNRGSVSSKATLWKPGPNLSRARGESSLRPFACKLESLPTTPNLGGQPIHTRAFAT